MINISHLSHQFPQASQPVLKDVTLTIQPGTLTLVTGSSGSGKSTFLRCLNGLVPHFSGGSINGEIDVFGLNPIQQGPQVLAERVGFVFQEPEAQFVFDTVEDEIAFALENYGIPREEMHHRVQSILDLLSLNEIKQRKIQDLSGGEKQKIAIASALVFQPKLLLLDEPTSQLDPASADEILQIIVSLKAEHGLTVVISEHRLERLLPYTDAIAYLSPEHALTFGSPQEILPKMDQVPPIITLARRFNVSPLPLSPQDFPEINLLHNSESNLTAVSNHSRDGKVMLDIDHLSVSIENKEILEDVILDLRYGEILTLLGTNGAGKTTLLRAILGLIPSMGKRWLKNSDMREMGLSDIIHHIGYLPQNPNDLLFADSVINELEITLKNHDMKKNTDELYAFLEELGLADKQNRYPRDLSVGERQRTALAAITIHEPEIIFLDEPTRGLDYEAKHKLAAIFQNWRNQGKSILLVTHDVEFAACLADRVAILEKGKIIFTGSPKIAFTQMPLYRTQTAKLFPERKWITPNDVPVS